MKSIEEFPCDSSVAGGGGLHLTGERHLTGGVALA